MNEREAIVATADRIAQRMGGRFVLNEETNMADKPEAVAWMYHKPGYVPSYSVERQVFPPEMGLVETPLYAHPPAQPDAAALVEALRELDQLCQHSFGSGFWRYRDQPVAKRVAAALSAWEQSNG